VFEEGEFDKLEFKEFKFEEEEFCDSVPGKFS
jgi:hypothetical protein